MSRLFGPEPVAARGGDAVASGGALLYGRIVEAPYLLEVVGEEILLNGVTIFPSPGPRVAAPQATRDITDEHDLVTNARATYSAEQASLGAEQAREHFRATVMALPNFEEEEPERWGFEHHVASEELRLTALDGKSFPLNVDGSTLICGGAASIRLTGSIGLIAAETRPEPGSS